MYNSIADGNCFQHVRKIKPTIYKNKCVNLDTFNFIITEREPLALSFVSFRR